MEADLNPGAIIMYKKMPYLLKAVTCLLLVISSPGLKAEDPVLAKTGVLFNGSQAAANLKENLGQPPDSFRVASIQQI